MKMLWRLQMTYWIIRADWVRKKHIMKAWKLSGTKDFRKWYEDGFTPRDVIMEVFRSIKPVNVKEIFRD